MQSQLARLSEAVQASYELAQANRIGAGTTASSLVEYVGRSRRAVRAGRQPICVGVFGPSQVGKSFLIGQIARNGDERLWIQDPEVSAGRRANPDKPWIRKPDASNGHIDFMTYINTEERNETTAIVCRFTRQPVVPAVGSDTFVAQALSYQGLLRSLVAGVYHECTIDVDEKDLQRLVEKAFAGAVRGGAHRDGFVEDLVEVWDTVRRRNADYHYYRIASDMVLRRLADVTSIPDARDRRLCAALLWGGAGTCPSLDAMYDRLLRCLEAIRHAPYIEVPSRVVAGGSRSPVYVKQLLSLLTEEETVEVLARPEGQEPLKVRLTVPEICAITAELCLTVARLAPHPQHDLLEKGDILDFPGAEPVRGNEGFRRVDFDGAAGGESAGLMLKRGKLTYLFERYCQEREITVLLLCLSENTFKAHQLPRQVYEWIRTRYPGHPKLEPAEAQDPSLFVVVTRFDQFLQPMAGNREQGEQNHWSAFFRGAGQYLEGSQRIVHKWFSGWHRPDGQAGRPFQNTYWVRNPIYTLSENALQYLPEHERSYGESEEVQRHVADAERKWRCALPNENSGVEHLVGAVFRKFDPALKRRELQEELQSIRQDVTGMLQEHYRSTDGDERRRKSREAAQHLVEELDRGAPEYERFGPLLQQLTLPGNVIDETVVRCESRRMATEGFIDEVVTRWHEHLVERLGDPDTAARLGLTPPALTRLVHEIATRARGANLRRRLSAHLDFFFASGRDIRRYANTLRRACLKLWGDFLADLDIPMRADPLPPLPPKRRVEPPCQRFVRHWRQSLPTVYEQNTGINLQEPVWNRALGEILGRLQAVAAAE